MSNSNDTTFWGLILTAGGLVGTWALHLINRLRNNAASAATAEQTDISHSKRLDDHENQLRELRTQSSEHTAMLREICRDIKWMRKQMGDRSSDERTTP